MRVPPRTSGVIISWGRSCTIPLTSGDASTASSRGSTAATTTANCLQTARWSTRSRRRGRRGVARGDQAPGAGGQDQGPHGVQREHRLGTAGSRPPPGRPGRGAPLPRSACAHGSARRRTATRTDPRRPGRRRAGLRVRPLLCARLRRRRRERCGRRPVRGRVPERGAAEAHGPRDDACPELALAARQSTWSDRGVTRGRAGTARRGKHSRVSSRASVRRVNLATFASSGNGGVRCWSAAPPPQRLAHAALTGAGGL